jgi:hypothetical protein
MQEIAVVVVEVEEVWLVVETAWWVGWKVGWGRGWWLPVFVGWLALS